MGIRCDLCGEDVENVLYDMGDHNVIKCSNCGLVFKSSIAQFGEDELYAHYDADDGRYYFENPNQADYTIDYKENSYRVRQWQQSLKRLEAYKASQGTNLLDVGCSTGVFLDIARRNGWNTAGVDVSSYATNYAREEFKLDVFTGTLEEAKFPTEHFDVVTLWGVIEHLTAPSQTIAEANRILKPGGIILVSTPNVDSLIHVIGHILYKLSRERLFVLIKHLYGNLPFGHLYFFSRRTLSRLLETHNFNIVFLGRGALRPEGNVKTNKIERNAAILVDALGAVLNKRYRMIIIGQKPLLTS